LIGFHVNRQLIQQYNFFISFPPLL